MRRRRPPLGKPPSTPSTAAEGSGLFGLLRWPIFGFAPPMVNTDLLVGRNVPLELIFEHRATAAAVAAAAAAGVALPDLRRLSYRGRATELRARRAGEPGSAVFILRRAPEWEPTSPTTPPPAPGDGVFAAGGGDIGAPVSASAMPGGGAASGGGRGAALWFHAW